MGVEYRAAIVVGLPRKNLAHVENLEEMIEEDSLRVCAPYFDGDSDEDALIGLIYEDSPDYGYTEVEFDQEKLSKLKSKFEELTNSVSKVFLSTQGW